MTKSDLIMTKEIEIPEGCEARIEGNKVVIVPKESEDERIRKWIKKELESKYVVDNIVNNTMADKAFAYLEKQKEQKPVISNEAIREGVAHFGITQYQIDNWLKKHINVVEQKPAEIDEYKIIKKHITEDSLSSEVNKRLKECGWYVTYDKPAEWSEEDKKNLQGVISEIEANKNTAPSYDIPTYDRFLSWLKSLRPQPHKWYIKKGHWYMCIVDKPEYGWTKGRVYQSPEDNRIETNYKGSLTNWPNSEPWFRPATRDEIPDSQPHWNPSEEQIAALSRATNRCVGVDDAKILIKLLEQLEKLYSL